MFDNLGRFSYPGSDVFHGKREIFCVAGLTVVSSCFVVLMRLPSLNVLVAIHTSGLDLVGVVGELLDFAVDFLCVGKNHRYVGVSVEINMIPIAATEVKDAPSKNPLQYDSLIIVRTSSNDKLFMNPLYREKTL